MPNEHERRSGIDVRPVAKPFRSRSGCSQEPAESKHLTLQQPWSLPTDLGDQELEFSDLERYQDTEWMMDFHSSLQSLLAKFDLCKADNDTGNSQSRARSPSTIFHGSDSSFFYNYAPVKPFRRQSVYRSPVGRNSGGVPSSNTLDAQIEHILTVLEKVVGADLEAKGSGSDERFGKTSLIPRTPKKTKEMRRSKNDEIRSSVMPSAPAACSPRKKSSRADGRRQYHSRHREQANLTDKRPNSPPQLKWATKTTGQYDLTKNCDSDPEAKQCKSKPDFPTSEMALDPEPIRRRSTASPRRELTETPLSVSKRGRSRSVARERTRSESQNRLLLTMDDRATRAHLANLSSHKSEHRRPSRINQRRASRGSPAFDFHVKLMGEPRPGSLEEGLPGSQHSHGSAWTAPASPAAAATAAARATRTLATSQLKTRPPASRDGNADNALLLLSRSSTRRSSSSQFSSSRRDTRRKMSTDEARCQARRGRTSRADSVAAPPRRPKSSAVSPPLPTTMDLAGSSASFDCSDPLFSFDDSFNAFLAGNRRGFLLS